jgi:hypothetical protein
MKSQLNISPLKTEDFVRYEFKYFLSIDARERIESEVANFMSYDGHVHDELDQAYFVRSLYFENRLAVHYYEKIDGIKYRKKFRLRSYGKIFAPDTPVYLEEKNRNFDRVHKHRILIDPDHLPIFYDPSRYEELTLLYPNVDIIDRFIYAAIRKEIRPRLLVDYIRRPYVSSYDMNFRVTFDSHLISMPGSVLFPVGGGNWKQSVAGYTILEVKFFRRIPAWFHRILQAQNMKRLSFSKFVKGMEVTGLAIDIS